MGVDPASRIAVVGVGSAMRGDDAAGLEIAARLTRLESDRLLAVEAGVAPENFTSVVKRFEPDHVVLVDAVELGGDPGDVRVVDPDDLRDDSFSSHNYPISLLAEYLRRETDAEISLLGVQPASIDAGEGLSQPVEDAVQRLVDEITAAVAGAREK